MAAFPRGGPYLKVVTGPMCGGKTTALVGAWHANGGLLVTNEFDKRSSIGIKMHEGNEIEALHVKRLADANIRDGGDVFVDEAQFFDADLLIADVKYLLARGCRVFVAGLDMDSDKNEYPYLKPLEAMSNVCTYLVAHCTVCEAPAPFTRCNVAKDGFLLDDAEGASVYEPVCGKHWTPTPHSNNE